MSQAEPIPTGEDPERLHGQSVYGVSDILPAIEELEHDQDLPGTTDGEYLSWVAEVFSDGLPSSGIWKELYDLMRLEFTDDGGTDLYLKLEPHIEIIQEEVLAAYQDSVNGTITDLNQFVALHPDLLHVGSADGPILLRLGIKWADMSVIGRTPPASLTFFATDSEEEDFVNLPTKLFIDISKLDAEQRQAAESYVASEEFIADSLL